MRCKFWLQFKCMAMKFNHVANIQIFLKKFK